MTDAPDYLAEVEAALRRDPLSKIPNTTLPTESFSTLQEDARRDQLLQILVAALDLPNGTTRKTAAFALGQVGDEGAIEALERHLSSETARGNIEALEAALATLREMPRSSGSTEEERRKAVENAYFGRPLRSQAASPYGGPETSAESATSSPQLQRENKGGCFIATASCGSPDAKEVVLLTLFRDTFLLRHACGRVFVSFYYSVSPFFSTLIAKSPTLRGVASAVIVRPAAAFAERVLCGSVKQMTWVKPDPQTDQGALLRQSCCARSGTDEILVETSCTRAPEGGS